MTIDVKIDTGQLQAYFAKMGEKSSEALRPAAAAGARIIQEEAIRLAGRSAEPHWFYGTSYKRRPGQRFPSDKKVAGRYLFYPGTLKDSIYRVYSKGRSSRNKAVYHVSWNHFKAPYGMFVERGLSPFTSKSRPFLRPAVINKMDAAVDEMAMVLFESMA